MHDTITVFVYGTLKRGGRNHDLYCRGYDRVAPGVVHGRLIELDEGCPMLFAPPADVIERGGADRAADVALGQELLEAQALQSLHRPSPAPPWALVTGEVYTLDQPIARLEALDLLEWFQPDGPSDYCRVILPVYTESRVLPCWAYISPHSAEVERTLIESLRADQSQS